ncbi:MAG: HAMP domain-containing sensor histidine kinase [Eubacteriales bacterium]|nr:HAMP domain-containing sensor histidine kinase [Eubacteriales bacterium]
MIRTLQKRFLLVSMTAISILLVVLLGTINAANCYLTNRQIDTLLHMLTSNEGRFPSPENQNEGAGRGPEPRDFFNPPIDEDTAMATRYFFVRFDANGKPVHIDVSRISSVSEEEAIQYAREAVESGRESGHINSFKYQTASTLDGQGMVAVFVDISAQFRSLLLVLFFSVCMGLICWLLMLLLVLLLSKKAILPIARNIEKQKQFVTNAGHEIKTPLAIILANTEAMELHQGESKWSKNIRAQTIRLSGLMQNLLALAKMDESEMKLPTETLSLSELLTDTAASFSEAAALKQLSLTPVIEAGLSFQGNRENLTQLFTVLLDNAIRYTPEGGCVSLSLKRQEKNLVFQIKNAYAQKPADNPEQLFDRFYRGDQARTQKSGGYGIGLSVADAIVQSYRGSICASYEEPNIIVFTIKVPDCSRE